MRVFTHMSCDQALRMCVITRVAESHVEQTMLISLCLLVRGLFWLVVEGM